MGRPIVGRTASSLGLAVMGSRAGGGVGASRCGGERVEGGAT